MKISLCLLLVVAFVASVHGERIILDPGGKIATAVYIGQKLTSIKDTILKRDANYAGTSIRSVNAISVPTNDPKTVSYRVSFSLVKYGKLKKVIRLFRCFGKLTLPKMLSNLKMSPRLDSLQCNAMNVALFQLTTPSKANEEIEDFTRSSSEDEQ